MRSPPPSAPSSLWSRDSKRKLVAPNVTCPAVSRYRSEKAEMSGRADCWWQDGREGKRCSGNKIGWAFFFYSNGVLFFKQLVLLQVWVLTMISNDSIQVSSKASNKAVCTPVYECKMRQKQWNSSCIYKFKKREREIHNPSPKQCFYFHKIWMGLDSNTYFMFIGFLKGILTAKKLYDFYSCFFIPKKLPPRNACKICF